MHFLNRIVYLLFVLPYEIWCKSVANLAGRKNDKLQKADTIDTKWPFLTFLKRVFFDFWVDGIILILPLYILGIYIYDMCELPSYTFKVICLVTVFDLILPYIILPQLMRVVRDVVELCLIPFRKFLNWGSKPAQYVDVEVKQK